MRLRLSRSAVQDIEDAWVHTAERWGPGQADALADRLDDTCRLLLQFPEVGRRREELARGMRSVPVSGFVVLYRMSGDVLEIVRVVHGSRDLDGLFSARDS